MPKQKTEPNNESLPAIDPKRQAMLERLAKARAARKPKAQKLPESQPFKAAVPSFQKKVGIPVDVFATKRPVLSESDVERRLFQTKPGTKEWLTKEEALTLKHFWNDKPYNARKDLVQGVPDNEELR
jgi:hypothetical protein